MRPCFHWAWWACLAPNTENGALNLGQAAPGVTKLSLSDCNMIAWITLCVSEAFIRNPRFLCTFIPTCFDTIVLKWQPFTTWRGWISEWSGGLQQTMGNLQARPAPDTDSVNVIYSAFHQTKVAVLTDTIFAYHTWTCITLCSVLSQPPKGFVHK